MLKAARATETTVFLGITGINGVKGMPPFTVGLCELLSSPHCARFDNIASGIGASSVFLRTDDFMMGRITTGTVRTLIRRHDTGSRMADMVDFEFRINRPIGQFKGDTMGGHIGRFESRTLPGFDQTVSRVIDRSEERRVGKE